MQYIVVSSEILYESYGSTKGLIEKVNDKLLEGYECLGGIATEHYSTDTDYSYSNGGLTKFTPKHKYLQSMIKKSTIYI